MSTVNRTVLHTLGAVVAAGLLCARVFLVPWGGGPPPGPPSAGDPARGRPFWVDPVGRAEERAALRRHRGPGHGADLVRGVADEPTAVWLTGDDPEARVRAITVRARLAGRIPVLTAYNIPHRDCGRYSAGGAPGAAAYRGWVRRLAAGIEDRAAWVVLEPDAVADAVTCPRRGAGEEEIGLLADAVRTLKALPSTAVYVDAGNAGWVNDLPRLAQALRAAGVGRADGFALNVSNFQTTPVTVSYGRRLSALLGGAHFVIDTSRNGAGPLRSRAGGPAQEWCNPPGRALGHPPTVATGDRLVDAYLWVKRPGESDGSCRGGPPAGRWWPDYALRLARAAQVGRPLSARGPSGPRTVSPGHR